MTALSERVMPTTDTPGAIAAGVPEYIEKLLADWASPDDRKPILAGLDAIEARSRSDYKVAADKATPAQQDALLTLAMEDRSEEHTSELQSLMRISYAVFCLK